MFKQNFKSQSDNVMLSRILKVGLYPKRKKKARKKDRDPSGLRSISGSVREKHNLKRKRKRLVDILELIHSID